MATYESLTSDPVVYTEETSGLQNASRSITLNGNPIPVDLLETDSNSQLLVRTRAELIEGVLPVSKGGTGLDSLSGNKLIASNVDGQFMEEVDVRVEYLAGLKENVQKRLDAIRTYLLFIATTDWISDENGYYAEIFSPGIKSTDSPIAALASTAETKAQLEELNYAYGCIDKIDTADDMVVIRCFDEMPTIDFAIRLIFV